MNNRYIVSSLLALIAGLGFMPEAKADLWCEAQGGPSNFQTPECPDSPGYNDGSNLWVTQGFIHDVCSRDASPNPGSNPRVDFVVTYPDPAYYSGNKKFPLVVLQHGGALYNTFYDKHSTDTASGSHHISPYQELAMTMASKGAVVITAAFPESSGAPNDAATTLANAIGCFNERVTTQTCTGSASTPCFTALVGKVSPEITFIGHSSGGVIGLYLPNHYQSGIRGLILMDPAKGDWLNTAPKRLSQSQIPIVHLYPDYYGPAKDANNELFRLGFSKTCSGGSKAGYGCRTSSDCPGGSCSNNTPPYNGPWIPLGIRELPTGLGGPNPNAGHHQVHHCMGMSSFGSFEYGNGVGHEAFCDIGVSCTKPSIECGSLGQYCGPQQSCIDNIKNGVGWNLSGADLLNSSNMITQRYVAAFSACFGADYGHYYQSWVNGMDRYYDDAGTGHSCTKNGYQDSTCGAHTDFPSCAYDTANDCKWAMAQEKYCVGGTNAGAACYDGGLNCYGGGSCSGTGKVIRINNGQTGISDYGLPVSGDTRFYTSGMSSYNASNGQFNEQTERLGTTAGAAYAPRCGAMTSFF